MRWKIYWINIEMRIALQVSLCIYIVIICTGVHFYLFVFFSLSLLSFLFILSGFVVLQFARLYLCVCFFTLFCSNFVWSAKPNEMERCSQNCPVANNNINQFSELKRTNKQTQERKKKHSPSKAISISRSCLEKILFFVCVSVAVDRYWQINRYLIICFAMEERDRSPRHATKPFCYLLRIQIFDFWNQKKKNPWICSSSLICCWRTTISDWNVD